MVLDSAIPSTSASTSTLNNNGKSTNSSTDNNPKKCEDNECIPHHITKDVGLYLDKTPDDYTKFLLLEEHWQPPPKYIYPYSMNSKGVKLYLSGIHLDKHPWLVLSESKKGLFCKYCALFAQEKAGHNKGAKLGKLVIDTLTKFKDLTGKDGDLQNHKRSLYHKNCIDIAKNFLKTYKSPDKEVVNQVSSERLRQVTENCERLTPIIKT